MIDYTLYWVLYITKLFSYCELTDETVIPYFEQLSVYLIVCLSNYTCISIYLFIYCGRFMRTYSHYIDVIMSPMASQITSLTIVYSTVYSGLDQRKHQSSASLAFLWGIHRWPVNSPHKGPVTRKMFPFDDVIVCLLRPSSWDAYLARVRILTRRRQLVSFQFETM